MDFHHLQGGCLGSYDLQHMLGVVLDLGMRRLRSKFATDDLRPFNDNNGGTCL